MNSNDEQTVFTSGDPVLVIGTVHDGKVGTVLRRRDGEYLVALEDGAVVVLQAESLTFRH